MKTFIVEYVPLITGFYMLAAGVIINTKDFKSALLFNYIPFILGLLLVIPVLAKYVV